MRIPQVQFALELPKMPTWYVLIISLLIYDVYCIFRKCIHSLSGKAVLKLLMSKFWLNSCILPCALTIRHFFWQVRSLVGDRMALLVQAFSAVMTAFIMGLVIAWRLALVMIAFQPIIILCFYTRKILLKCISKKAMKAQDESSKLAAEAVSNLRTIAAFSSQDRILKMLQKAQEATQQESIRQSCFAGTGLAFSRGLTSCVTALDFWYGGKLIA